MQRALTTLLLAASAAAADGIVFERDLEAARAAAARDGRPVLLYFTFDT
ncbi:MAG: hypothetical protein ACT4PV_06665 [Planctomycetaceae bacterium]